MSKLQPIKVEHGVCGVCVKTAMLTHRCTVTGIVVGRCCLKALQSAEVLIDLGMKLGGPCHPPIKEAA